MARISSAIKSTFKKQQICLKNNFRREQVHEIPPLFTGQAPFLLPAVKCVPCNTAASLAQTAEFSYRLDRTYQLNIKP